MLEAKAKDTKKSKAKDSPSDDRHSRGQGQKRSRPRTKDTSASVLSPKKSLQNIFQAFSSKNATKKFFLGDLKKFNKSKKSAVLEPRTGRFWRT